jgi:hypothetical protein
MSGSLRRAGHSTSEPRSDGRRRPAPDRRAFTIVVGGYRPPSTQWRGDAPLLSPPPVGVTPRQLDWKRTLRELPRCPRPSRPALIQVIDDHSGSVLGGNDASGLRSEALAIALHRISESSGGEWSFSYTVFDHLAPAELEATKLNRRGVSQAEAVLMTPPTGSTSSLARALADAERAAPRNTDRLLMVMSDFELIEPDVSGVLRQFINSSADHKVALVLRSQPPEQLLDSDVDVIHVDPAVDPPEQVAHHLINAASALLAAA